VTQGAAPSSTDRAAPRDEFAQALSECMPLFWLAGAFSGAVNLLFLASPIYLIQIYNRVIPSGSMATLGALSLVLLLALLTLALLDAVRIRLLIKAAARLDRKLSGRVLQAVLDLSRTFGAGRRNAQPLRDLDLFRSALAGPAAQLLFDAPWTPLFLIALFLIHPILGATALVGGGIFLGLAYLNDRLTREISTTASDAGMRSYGLTEALARHADPVHAMGMAPDLARHWRGDREAMLGHQAEAGDRNADFTAAIKFVRLALQGAMLGIGAVLAVNNQILPASIFAASLLMGRALAPLEQAVIGWRQLIQALEAGRRVQKALNEAPPASERTRVPTDRPGAVRLRGVTYVPPGAKLPALQKITLEIESGQALGVIGASGAGKTSLARLITAAAAPTAGKITLGGVDARRWRREDLARHVGYLPQAVGLLPGTVRDNIARFGAVDDAQVVAAARRANVHEMILALPEGYETPVHDGGAGLSGGERQRIGLARALFGDPCLLVLDEPNAHLDEEGEHALAQTLTDLSGRGVTIILVAHRLAPLNHVDRIVLLDKGRVAADDARHEFTAPVPVQVTRTFAAGPREARA